MKVICIDNYDRADASDELVAANVTPAWAERIKTALNETSRPAGPEYFVVRPDDYELRTCEA